MLTGEQLADYNRGMLALDLELTAEFCSQLLAEVSPFYGTGSSSGCFADASGRRIQDAWHVSHKVHELARHPTILQALQDLYGRTPLPFQTLNLSHGTEQKAHADTIHCNSLPAGYMCSALVALEDVHVDSGPQLYWPGTHRWQEITMQVVGVAPTVDNYPLYEQYVGGRLLTEPPPWQALLRRGCALIMHGNLVHCGAKRINPALTQHVQHTHYFFPGCRYYTPLLSSPAQAHWRQPSWIP